MPTIQASSTLNAALAQSPTIAAPTTNDTTQGMQQEVAEDAPIAQGFTEPETSAGQSRKRGIEAAEADANPSTSPQGVDAPLAKRMRTRKGVAAVTAPSSTRALLPPTTPLPPPLPSIELPQAKVAIPPDAPKWFESTLSMLQVKEWGPSWCALIKAWTDFEVRHKFKEVAKLGAKNRPECIQEWMRRRRSTSWKPPINGVSAFESSFMSWWASLQPDWRLLADGRINFSAVEGNWDGLRRPGLRGLHNVVVGLFYWALEVENENKGRAQWLIAVDDCRMVCGCLFSSAA